MREVKVRRSRAVARVTQLAVVCYAERVIAIVALLVSLSACVTRPAFGPCKGSLEEGYFTPACHYSSALPLCQLSDVQMQQARTGMAAYLRVQTGSDYVYYDYPGAISAAARDVGAQCRFYVEPHRTERAELLHGALFIFVDKNSLTPVGKARIVW
jgi:hypothetical protein